jgi:hypothetical protein
MMIIAELRMTLITTNTWLDGCPRERLRTDQKRDVETRPPGGSLGALAGIR